ncbi:MAG: tetratricopeptide repeat protein [Candidatus Heimdallarchaeota archaeon]
MVTINAQQRICIIGMIPDFPEDSVRAFLADQGYELVSAVDKDLDLLIIGEEQDASVIQKAKEFDITCFLWNEFLAEDALTNYQAILEVMSHFPGVWIDKGLILRKLGRFEDALACFDQTPSIAQNPAGSVTSWERDTYASNIVWAWANKGVIFADYLEKATEALSCFEEALQRISESDTFETIKKFVVWALKDSHGLTTLEQKLATGKFHPKDEETLRRSIDVHFMPDRLHEPASYRKAVCLDCSREMDVSYPKESSWSSQYTKHYQSRRPLTCHICNSTRIKIWRDHRW